MKVTTKTVTNEDVTIAVGGLGLAIDVGGARYVLTDIDGGLCVRTTGGRTLAVRPVSDYAVIIVEVSQ